MNNEKRNPDSKLKTGYLMSLIASSIFLAIAVISALLMTIFFFVGSSLFDAMTSMFPIANHFGAAIWLIYFFALFFLILAAALYIVVFVLSLRISRNQVSNPKNYGIAITVIGGIVTLFSFINMISSEISSLPVFLLSAVILAGGILIIIGKYHETTQKNDELIASNNKV